MARHHYWRSAPLFLIATLFVGVPLPLQAQDGAGEEAAESSAPTEAELTLARERFGHGLELSDRGEWQDAVSIFRQVLRVSSAPPVLFNLAVALVELDEFDEAEELLTSVLADEATQPRIRIRAERLLERMTEDGAQLTVALEGAVADVFVTLDERELAADRVGVALRVSSGTHVVAAERAGDEVARQEVEVASGAAETVTLDIAAPASETLEVPELALAPDAAAPPDSSGGGLSWQAWAGIGGGVAAVIIVVVAVSVAGGGGDGDPFVGDFTPSTLVWR